MLARSGGAACDDLRPVLAKANLESLESIELDPRFGIELSVEASSSFPKRAGVAAISCRARGAGSERPSRQYAVAFKREKRRLVPAEIVRTGDEASYLEGIVLFVADVDGDGDPELGMRGALVESKGAEHVEGEAETFVFFSAKKPLLVKKRVRRTVAAEDGAIARSGIAQRAVAKKKSVVVAESVLAAADDAALDRFWEESTGEDVLSGRTGDNRISTRTVAQTGDGEVTIFEAGTAKKKLAFRGRIARVVRNGPGMAAAIYVVEAEDARELYVVDLEALEMRRAPKNPGDDEAIWAWSPDGAHAVYAPAMSVLSAKQWRAWIKTGVFSASEARLPKMKRAPRFVRWTTDEAFELVAERTHYRVDMRAKKASKLYDVPRDE